MTKKELLVEELTNLMVYKDQLAHILDQLDPGLEKDILTYNMKHLSTYEGRLAKFIVEEDHHEDEH